MQASAAVGGTLHFTPVSTLACIAWGSQRYLTTHIMNFSPESSVPLPTKKVLIRAWLVVFGLVLLPCIGFAGQFSVSPVRIYVAAKDRTTAVTVTNESDVELVLQADVFQWKQTSTGQEDLTLTEDLIVAPPIIKLAPRARQIIRLAMLKPVPPDQQVTYRLIVREIPEAKPPEPGVQLQIALAFSMPIFISPPGVKRQLACVSQRAAPDAVRVTCENTGNAYAHASDFKLSNASGELMVSSNVGGYILPGIKRSFELKRTGSPIPDGKVQLVVTQDDLSVQTFDGVLAD